MRLANVRQESGTERRALLRCARGAESAPAPSRSADASRTALHQQPSLPQCTYTCPRARTNPHARMRPFTHARTHARTPGTWLLTQEPSICLTCIVKMFCDTHQKQH
eukprot:4489198-Pleurochrysis_carterae.AAC.1